MSRPAGWLRRASVVLLALAALAGADDPPKPDADPTAPARLRMVERHLAERGIKDERVLEAFRTVPRHRFVPPDKQQLAYEDESIPIGLGQTITPPMTSPS